MAKPQAEPKHYTNQERLSAALAYGVSSFLIMFVNKAVLTIYAFPSSMFLALAQFVGTVIGLQAMKTAGKVSFPDFSAAAVWKVFPLPLIFLINTVTGLGGTKSISLPMFTVLRRMTMLSTMLGEFYFLGVHHSKAVQICVATMIGGALVAALDDLAFDASGYTMILINDLATSANGVVLKSKLDSKELGRWGLMFYNSLLSIPLLVVFMAVTQPDVWRQASEFDQWANPGFVLLFVLSSVMGFILNYSVFLCTEVNSPLTTSVIGALKNVLVTYSGMMFGGDYIFSITNFLGINVSMLGSLIYARVTFVEKNRSDAARNAARHAVDAGRTSPSAKVNAV